ncbi:hypothetical protein BGZ65_001210 [Modicella reniformis]|uniref:Major facilitator superfamily (MFS) profile domain-containing protein n=1 Tax=Modicella reniformis TaxID=1440133 RepID=A0A9P6MJF5_9FUNG|nr:hypothetical protein BGZ65_001210 [Modicella reniformis]
MFVIARALQGVGAAGTLPTAMAIIATNYPPDPERAKAFSVFAAFGGMGAVAGILLAGGLVSSIGWSWIFRISSIAGYILLILGYITIPPAGVKKDVKPKVDNLGTITATLGITGIVYYISTGVEYGWAHVKSLPVLIVGLVFTALFIGIETKVDAPFVPPSNLAIPNFFDCSRPSFRFHGHGTGRVSSTLLPIQVIAIRDADNKDQGLVGAIYQTGLQLGAPFGIAILNVVAISTNDNASHVGEGSGVSSGGPQLMKGFRNAFYGTMVMSAFGFVLALIFLPWDLFIIHIFGVGFSMLPIQITAVRDADNKDQGLVGAIYNTGLQLGISVSTNESVIKTDMHLGPALMKGYKNAFYGIISLGALWDSCSR